MSDSLFVTLFQSEISMETATPHPQSAAVRSQNVVCTARDVYLTVNRARLAAGGARVVKTSTDYLRYFGGPNERCRLDRSASVGQDPTAV